MGNHYLCRGSGELDVCRGFISFLMVTAMADRETLDKLRSQVGEEQGLGVTCSETQSKTALGSSEKRAVYQKKEIGLTAGGNGGRNPPRNRTLWNHYRRVEITH